ncbi:interleukin-1 beta [Labrus mixtus]|uniref:interleukin-1 beta n=1 Tax=Labrus mixtus TaxID=508554 RepID=UPI0029C0F744|nr:interleukin-1 beta [Labrus mixtus]
MAMSDFHLSQALADGSSDFDDKPATPAHMEQAAQNKPFRLEDGLELVVSDNTKSMQYAATLLLAVNRLKKPLTRCSRELCSAIFNCLVEETIVKTTVNFGVTNTRYIRSDSETQFALSDISNKSIILDFGVMKLQAVTLMGGNEDCRVNFKLSKFYSFPLVNCETVLLSINKYSLSSTMNGGKAELTLELCSEENLSNINNDKKLQRFLFYKKAEGTHMTFESVSCPGWFISTYEEEHLSVDMCCGRDAQRNRNFIQNDKKLP